MTSKPASTGESLRALVRTLARARDLGLAAALVAACIATPGCAGFLRWPWGNTQRWPAPMEAKVDPLPPGDSMLYPPGPEDVLVVRHADPVQVRPAGMPSSYPLWFYNKSLRVSSGSAVYSAPGGRIEVIWPSATSVVLYGRGAGIIGSKSRGEPTFLFRQIERAEMDFKKEDQVELLGGAQLSAHSGPIMLDHTRASILRVKNQSKAAAQIAYREANFVIDPGQVIDLPLLSVGAKPIQTDAGLVTIAGAGFAVQYSGQVEVLAKQADVVLRAVGEHEIHALGVRVRLDREDEVRFGGLSSKAAAEPAAALAPLAPPPTDREEPAGVVPVTTVPAPAGAGEPATEPKPGEKPKPAEEKPKPEPPPH
jgi:hypothetical protein